MVKWFRVDNVSEAKLDHDEPFRDTDAAGVDAFLHESLEGFHDGKPPSKHEFFVSDPDARWVALNLLDEMRAEEVPGGIRIVVHTSALKPLARFVVGLGGAAKPLTADLENEVTELAQGALAAIEKRRAL